MKKIAIIGNDVNSMINFRLDFIKLLSKQGHEVYCLATNFSEDDRTLFKSIGAIPINYKFDSKGINPIKDIKASYELKRLLKQISPDIVFSYFVKPVIFSSIAAKMAKVPMVIGMIEGLGNVFTMHNIGQSFKTRLLKKIQVALYKFSLPKLDTVIFLNEDDKKDLIEKYKIKTKNIIILGAIGVDLEKNQYSKPKINPVSFIFIGRLLKEKGIFEYLKAAELVKIKHPESLFYILGSFDKENHFALKEDVLSSYLRQKTIIYPGYVSNTQDWIKKSSVFVLPSYREGFPHSTQEAMAIGRPVITTDVTGCRETVVEGRNGFLIPPFSSEILAERMIYFIENSQEIEKMGIESRKIAERDFDISVVNKKLCQIMHL